VFWGKVNCALLLSLECDCLQVYLCSCWCHVVFIYLIALIVKDHTCENKCHGTQFICLDLKLLSQNLWCLTCGPSNVFVDWHNFRNEGWWTMLVDHGTLYLGRRLGRIVTWPQSCFCLSCYETFWSYLPPACIC
jgi:hypothetical protein